MYSAYNTDLFSAALYSLPFIVFSIRIQADANPATDKILRLFAKGDRLYAWLGEAQHIGRTVALG